MIDKAIAGVILVVEDPFIARFLQRLLVKAGYRVMPAEAVSALQALREGTVAVELLITNVPAIFIELCEHIPVLYLAAFPDQERASAFATCRTLHKPFRPRQLLDTVAELIGDAK